MGEKAKGAFYPAAEMRVPVTAANLYERVSSRNRTPPEGAVIGGRIKRRNHCCFLSIMEMLDNSTNYQHNAISYQDWIDIISPEGSVFALMLLNKR